MPPGLCVKSGGFAVFSRYSTGGRVRFSADSTRGAWCFSGFCGRIAGDSRGPRIDQEKTGRSIAARRKEQGLTQAALAEQLGITDRAVSKWETGRCLPDASLMLPLCALLKINVNKLLTGERIAMDDYKKIAEQNLVEMRRMEEAANKKLLRTAVMMESIVMVATFALILSGAYVANSNETLGIVLIVLGIAVLCISIIPAIRAEHDAGYYECPHCKARYVPTMTAVVMAPHFGFTRKMRCPHCNQRGYHKKVMTK